ncbi:MAG: DNA polymerase [Thermovirgaceae bacterium]|nr:DNA polymerase [Thermovirgaceae bacterium]
MPEKTVLLVDGHGLAFRAFYALPELNAPDGTPTNALLGFANMLLKTMDDVKPDLAAVIFDAPGPTFRHEAFEAYKEGRRPTPEEFKVQMPFIKDFSRDMGFPVIEKPGIEADDVIASTARFAAESGFRVVILTADKDILQVLAPDLSIMRPVKGVSEFRLYDPQSFTEDYGFAPAAMADYLALVGDTVDNVPGVKGVGDKTARALLVEHGSLESIYEHLDGMKPSLREKLEDGKETAFQSRELTRLRFDDPLEPEQLAIGKMQRENLAALFERFALKKLGERILGREDAPPAEAKAAPQPPRPPVVFKEEPLEELLKEDELALSWSGKGKYPQRSVLDEICLGSREGSFWSGSASPVVLGRVSEWGKTGKVITLGYKEICAAEPAVLPDPQKIWDAGLAHYALHPEVSNGEKREPSPENCARLWSLKEELEPLISSADLESVMMDIDTPLCPVLAAMEAHGIRVDQPLLRELEEELDLRTGEISTKIDALVGSHVNLNSPKQVAWLLFEKLKFPPIRKIKTGLSTDVSVLEELASLPLGDASVPKVLLEYREITKVITGFIHPLIKGTDPDTGCVHTTLEHAFTGTGRLSSRDPNLQNLPAFGTWAGRLRKALIPRKEGDIFIAGDYSQVELRILAHICGEDRLKNAFAQGRDIHTETAYWIFGGDAGSVTPEQRRMAKVVNFGLLYGMSAHGLSQRMGIRREEAASLISRYFRAFPRVKGYMEDSAREAKERGYTLTIFGRRRPLAEVSTVEGRGGGAIGRVAVNTPLQGSAADIARVAMIRYSRAVREAGLDAPLVLQVHDSLVCECSPSIRDEVSALLVSSMEGAASLSVPLEVQIKSGVSFEEI